MNKLEILKKHMIPAIAIMNNISLEKAEFHFLNDKDSALFTAQIWAMQEYAQEYAQQALQEHAANKEEYELVSIGEEVIKLIIPQQTNANKDNVYQAFEDLIIHAQEHDLHGEIVDRAKAALTITNPQL